MKSSGASNKLRVLRLLSRMNVGGPSRHVINLTRSLEKFGYETRLLAGLPESAEGSMLALAETQGVIPNIVARLDRPVLPLSDFAAFQQIVREIRMFRPHVVHTHTTKAGILGRLAAVFCGVPAIFHTYHGFIFSGYFSEPMARLIVGVERFLAGFSDRLITLTPNLAAELSERFNLTNQGKITAVPLGLELDTNLNTPRHCGRWRAGLGIPDDAFLAGIVARLVPVKNHKMLLHAVAELVKTRPNLHLAIVGGGELEADLQRQAARFGIANHVHFCGIVTDIEKVYSDLDLLILSSRNEGTPVVAIEALASGCPVAATGVGGVPELLEGGRRGFLLPVDVRGFTAGLAEAVDACRAGRYAIDDAMRRQWAEQFSVEALSCKIDVIYRKTLKIRGIDV